MKILAIKRQTRAERVNLYFEGGARISIPAESALRHGLRPGRELDPDQVAELEIEDGAWRTRDTALRLLARRPRTERDLQQRLLAREYPRSAVDSCILSLRLAGLIDDEAFARTFARERIRSRPRGPRALIGELRARGVAAAQAAAAVEEVLREEGVSPIDLGRDAARKFAARRHEEPRATRRRLQAFLARRGFPGDVILRIADELAPHRAESGPGEPEPG